MALARAAASRKSRPVVKVKLLDARSPQRWASAAMGSVAVNFHNKRRLGRRKLHVLNALETEPQKFHSCRLASLFHYSIMTEKTSRLSLDTASRSRQWRSHAWEIICATPGFGLLLQLMHSLKSLGLIPSDLVQLFAWQVLSSPGGPNDTPGVPAPTPDCARRWCGIPTRTESPFICLKKHLHSLATAHWSSSVRRGIGIALVAGALPWAWTAQTSRRRLPPPTDQLWNGPQLLRPSSGQQQELTSFQSLAVARAKGKALGRATWPAVGLSAAFCAILRHIGCFEFRRRSAWPTCKLLDVELWANEQKKHGATFSQWRTSRAPGWCPANQLACTDCSVKWCSWSECLHAPTLILCRSHDLLSIGSSTTASWPTLRHWVWGGAPRASRRAGSMSSMKWPRSWFCVWSPK